jgi:transposase InsO family protein
MKSLTISGGNPAIHLPAGAGAGELLLLIRVGHFAACNRSRAPATALGLKLCFTPVRSPESNGIAEAFVKTFKRDYARLSIVPDAVTVITLLPAWFEDYNEIHPHSGLKFLSPREFLRLSA